MFDLLFELTCDLLDALEYVWQNIKDFVKEIVNFTKKFFKNLLNELFLDAKTEKVFTCTGEVLKEAMKGAKETSMDELFDEDVVTIPIDLEGEFVVDDLKITRAEEFDFEIKEPLLISR